MAGLAAGTTRSRMTHLRHGWLQPSQGKSIVRLSLKRDPCPVRERSLPALRRAWTDSRPLRSRLRRGARRSLPPRLPVRASVGRALSRVASAAYERSRPRAAGVSAPRAHSDWGARFSIDAIASGLPHTLHAAGVELPVLFSPSRTAPGWETGRAARWWAEGKFTSLKRLSPVDGTATYQTSPPTSDGLVPTDGRAPTKPRNRAIPRQGLVSKP